MSRFYGIYLIIALIAMSGAVAYVGDIVGRRMGRKRLSLFGMRPRHTAIAISVVSGMFITILTLAAAMALSENVRIGFLRVGQMRAELRTLRRETASMRDEQTRLADQAKQLTARAEEANQQRLKATQDLQKAKQELAKSQRALQTTEASLTREQAKLQEAQRASQSAQAAVERQSKIVARLTEAQGKLSQQIKGLQQSRDWLQLELLGSLAKERSEGVIFDARQPLDVLLVGASQTPAAIRKQLEGFVSHLDTAVRRAGAKPREGEKQAVVVTELVPDPKAKDQYVWASQDRVLDGLLVSTRQAFTNDPSLHGIIVQASCLSNVHPGEPVPVNFSIFPNTLVFTKGQQLAQLTVPAGQSREKLAEAIATLLKGQVRAASEGKVIPRLDPSLPHGGTQSGNVGSGLTWGEMFDVLDRVQGLNGPARITAVAKADTWTIGPLNVELRVAPAP